MCGLDPSLHSKIAIYVLQIHTRKTAEAELPDLNVNLVRLARRLQGTDKKGSSLSISTCYWESKRTDDEYIYVRNVNTVQLYVLVANHFEICESARNQRIF